MCAGLGSLLYKEIVCLFQVAWHSRDRRVTLLFEWCVGCVSGKALRASVC